VVKLVTRLLLLVATLIVLALLSAGKVSEDWGWHALPVGVDELLGLNQG
jgi:hypothetical protein